MNIKLAISAVVLGTFLAAPITSFAKGGHGGGHGGALTADLYGKSSVYTAIYDTNGDGTVTTAEVTAVRTADYNKANTNTADDLTLAEFQNLQSTVQARHIAAVFASLDTDTSSTLTLAELVGSSTATTAINTAFALADADSNSLLSVTEFTNLQSKGTNSGIWDFARLDTDGSKTVSLTEYLAASARHH